MVRQGVSWGRDQCLIRGSPSPAHHIPAFWVKAAFPTTGEPAVGVPLKPDRDHDCLLGPTSLTYLRAWALMGIFMPRPRNCTGAAMAQWVQWSPRPGCAPERSMNVVVLGGIELAISACSLTAGGLPYSRIHLADPIHSTAPTCSPLPSSPHPPSKPPPLGTLEGN